jgi:hypothetical protein
MKKLFALFLISIMLLSSCAGIDKSGTGGGEKNFPYDVLVLTNKPPVPEDFYNEKKDVSLADIDHVIGDFVIPPRDYLTCEVNIDFKNIAPDTNIYGIFDDEKKFKSFFAATDTRRNYEDIFPDDFFDNYIILYMSYECREGGFDKINYSFDSTNNMISIHFSKRQLDGWEPMDIELVGYTAYLIPIAKSDITVDGKLVPYEELNIEVTGNLIAG